MRIGLGIGPFYASTGVGSGPPAGPIMSLFFSLASVGGVMGFVMANLTHWQGWYDLANERSISWTLTGALLSPIIYTAVALFVVACRIPLIGLLLVPLAFLISLVLGDPHHLVYVSVAAIIAVVPVVVRALRAPSPPL